MSDDAAPIRELARAKVNLTLHVTGRRPDGLHMLDSLVVFPRVGDLIEVEPSRHLSLTLDGPFGAFLSGQGDNLVLRAARMLDDARGAAIRLGKVLPVASGIGGGSADAAATLRALARLWQVELGEAAHYVSLGADVPVCLGSTPARMRGVGEWIGPVPVLPPLWCVLVNPGVQVATAQVFGRLDAVHNPPMDLPERFGGFEAFTDWLSAERNDLEPPALTLAPVIGEVLEALSTTSRFARMSGSGATCVALYPDEGAALTAAERIRKARSDWWCVAAPVA
ncbi:4-(cytidine 5'-diphospho)-2-C-methyl-D-erythritol kinase [Roseobacter sp. HKCCA0434]|uniref:4-(cytidine 5'-diphospho)-2-C-methyl-D-erythritol kinase n=1 Tax=Roseobacter sp. HKCCA0434 TaxID=3079297 RepID=UPI002905865D|nr:4-(cytidine 5'-diphospho)-2-C-methyl-D-erythritol kinase [Roseobacter sp. HKCCA0434]